MGCRTRRCGRRAPTRPLRKPPRQSPQPDARRGRRATAAAPTLSSPAYLAFNQAFAENEPGIAAAIAFVLFLIIIAMTLIQRWVLGERDASGMGRKKRKGADRQPGLLADGAARLEAGPQSTTGGGLT